MDKKIRLRVVTPIKTTLDTPVDLVIMKVDTTEDMILIEDTMQIFVS